MAPGQSFEQLLAQYVFSVADEYITLADSDQQARLIRLVYQHNSPDPVLDNVLTIVNPNRRKLSFSKPTQVSSPFSLMDLVNHPEEHSPKFVTEVSRSTTARALTKLKEADQQHGITLAELEDQLAQVKENLRLTQVKLEQCIIQHTLTLERCHKRMARFA